MIFSLDITNFKCFDQLKLPFGQLTFLTGFNGGGKSTAMQPLLLLSQGIRQTVNDRVFPLNGPLVHLGTVGDVLPSSSKGAIVRFGLGEPERESVWTFAAMRSAERHLHLEEVHSSGAHNLSLETLAYLSAVREGTADAYPIPDAYNDTFSGVGMDGRYAAYWYDKLVDDELSPTKRHHKEPATSFRKQLDAWMGTLFPGAQANVQIIPQISMLNLQFRLSEIGVWRRPANIGYGLSYAFPILVALLAAQPGQIVIIDSPEAHLHPTAQSRMGELLTHFAESGVQIIVETHSDHLLNGARIAVKRRVASPAKVRVHFFTGASSGTHGVISPLLDSEGKLSEWPEGFFDQSEKDLSRLAGWENG
jgi:predicted ATPase